MVALASHARTGTRLIRAKAARDAKHRAIGVGLADSEFQLSSFDRCVVRGQGAFAVELVCGTGEKPEGCNDGPNPSIATIHGILLQGWRLSKQGSRSKRKPRLCIAARFRVIVTSALRYALQKLGQARNAPRKLAAVAADSL